MLSAFPLPAQGSILCYVPDSAAINSSFIRRSIRSNMHSGIRHHKYKEHQSCDQQNTEKLKKDGFCLAVSLQDGTLIYVSSGVKKCLGYSKDMLIGQSIMNFLYPRDRLTFANQLSEGLNLRFNQDPGGSCTQNHNTFLCRLREYQSAQLYVSDKKATYKTFRMSVYIKDVAADDECAENSASNMCLIATAVPIVSAYEVPNETPAMTCFSTRHTASCHFCHVDLRSAPYLGFLPQDMLGHSVFDFFKPDELHQLKEIYEQVIKEYGHTHRGKPLHFRAFNGSYLLLETDWSCFCNPWTKKIEFVVGQHRVLRGPEDPDVFKENVHIQPEPENHYHLQESIRLLLARSITSAQHPYERRPRLSRRRHQELTLVLSSLVPPKPTHIIENKEEMGFVVMGAMSPHQDSDSEEAQCSSGSPPSVLETRYKDNIERYFASQTMNPADVLDIPSQSNESSNEDKPLPTETSTTEKHDAGGGCKRKHSSTGDSGNESGTQRSLSKGRASAEKSSSGNSNNSGRSTDAHAEQQLHESSIAGETVVKEVVDAETAEENRKTRTPSLTQQTLKLHDHLTYPHQMRNDFGNEESKNTRCSKKHPTDHITPLAITHRHQNILAIPVVCTTSPMWIFPTQQSLQRVQLTQTRTENIQASTRKESPKRNSSKPNEPIAKVVSAKTSSKTFKQPDDRSSSSGYLLMTSSSDNSEDTDPEIRAANKVKMSPLPDPPWIPMDADTSHYSFEPNETHVLHGDKITLDATQQPPLVEQQLAFLHTQLESACEESI